MANFPESVKIVYDPLYGTVWESHFRWKQYQQLFGTSQARIDLLNAFAPSFFKVVHNSLLDSTFLAISRLTDELESCRKANLVLKKLKDVVELEDPGISTRLELARLLGRVEEECKIIREIRNKRLAHNDLKIAMEVRWISTSRDQIEKALQAIRAFMGAIELHYLGYCQVYEDVSAIGDASVLIRHLEELKSLRKS